MDKRRKTTTKKIRGGALLKKVIDDAERTCFNSPFTNEARDEPCTTSDYDADSESDYHARNDNNVDSKNGNLQLVCEPIIVERTIYKDDSSSTVDQEVPVEYYRKNDDLSMVQKGIPFEYYREEDDLLLVQRGIPAEYYRNYCRGVSIRDGRYRYTDIKIDSTENIDIDDGQYDGDGQYNNNGRIRCHCDRCS